jgi:cytoskeletal protein RodZ
MKRVKAFGLVALFLGLSGFIIWQQTQLKRLATEAAALREQVTQAFAAQTESEPRAQSLPGTGQLPEESPSPELLRLRGEVAVLKRQLAEAGKASAARTPPPNSAELNPPTARQEESAASAEPVNLHQVSSLPADMPLADLGEVELSESTQKRVALANGQECVLQPTVLADGTVQIDLAVESKTADGQVQQLGGRSRITARFGQQCGITVGGIMVSLTPKQKP